MYPESGIQVNPDTQEAVVRSPMQNMTNSKKKKTPLTPTLEKKTP